MRLLPRLSSSLRYSTSILILLASYTPAALAGVVFTSPAAGTSLAPGPVTITWVNGGGAPAISLLSTYQIQLVVGGNEDADMVAVATMTTTGKFSAGNSITGTISSGVAGNTPNGYFFKMIAVATEGGTLTAYSDRFSMTGMIGTTPANAVAAVAALGGSTKGPAGINGVTNVQPAGQTPTVPLAPGPNSGLPYSQQTAGSVKYAPMQSIPPTQITAVNTAPLFPTSAFNIARTWLPPAHFVSTATEQQTFSVQSIQNTIPAAAQPSADMARFLARWKD